MHRQLLLTDRDLGYMICQHLSVCWVMIALFAWKAILECAIQIGMRPSEVSMWIPLMLLALLTSTCRQEEEHLLRCGLYYLYSNTGGVCSTAAVLQTRPV